jgi:hypothetical protein
MFLKVKNGNDFISLGMFSHILEAFTLNLVSP